METAEGDLAGLANLEETIQFFRWQVILGDDDFRYGIFFQSIFQGIKAAQNGAAVYFSSVVPFAIFDEANGSETKAGVVQEFI